MAKLINKGWSTSSDEIPQPISVTAGQQLEAKLQAAIATAAKKCCLPLLQKNLTHVKRSDRPKLAEALKSCRIQGAKLIIADREAVA